MKVYQTKAQKLATCSAEIVRFVNTDVDRDGTPEATLTLIAWEHGIDRSELANLVSKLVASGEIAHNGMGLVFPRN